VTVLLPAEDAAAQRVEAVWRGNRLQVKINGTKYNLK
jgi:heparinase II/III-like protein